MTHLLTKGARLFPREKTVSFPLVAAKPRRLACMLAVGFEQRGISFRWCPLDGVIRWSFGRRRPRPREDCKVPRGSRQGGAS